MRKIVLAALGVICALYLLASRPVPMQAQFEPLPVKTPKSSGTCDLVMTSTANTCEISTAEGVHGLAFSIADTGSAWTGTIQFQTQAPNTSIWFFLAGYNISDGAGTAFTNDFDTCTTSLGASAPACNQNKNGTWLATGIGGIQRMRLKVQTAGTNTARISWSTTGQSDYVFSQTFGDLQQNDPAQVNGTTYPLFTGYAVWPVMMGGHGFSPVAFAQPALSTLPAPITQNNSRATLAMTAYGEAMVQQIDRHLTGTIDATGEQLILPVMGSHSVSIQIRGTWNPGAGGQLVFQFSHDATNYTQAVGYNVETFTGAFDLASGAAGAASANGTWITVLTNGAAYFRVVHSGGTWSSGAATVTLRGTNAPPIQANFTFGDKAHDAVDSSTSPLKIGARAVSLGATPTAVADADRTNLYATRAGIQLTQPGHPNLLTREAQIADADGAQTGVLLSTDNAAGTRFIVTGVDVACSAANTVNVNVRVAFATTTTLPTASVNGVNQVLLRHPGVPPGGGISKGFNGGIVGIGADGEDIRYTIDDPVSGSCAITVNYYAIAN